jgi:hypothetical protein
LRAQWHWSEPLRPVEFSLSIFRPKDTAVMGVKAIRSVPVEKLSREIRRGGGYR